MVTLLKVISMVIIIALAATGMTSLIVFTNKPVITRIQENGCEYLQLSQAHRVISLTPVADQPVTCKYNCLRK